MIKFKKILEIKNTNPSGMKEKIFNYFINDHIHLLRYIVDNINEGKNFSIVPDSFVEGDTWEKWLSNEFGYEEEFISKLVNQIKQLYSVLRPGEAEVFYMSGEDNLEKTSIVNSKFIRIISDEEGYYVILTNF